VLQGESLVEALELKQGKGPFNLEIKRAHLTSLPLGGAKWGDYQLKMK